MTVKLNLADRINYAIELLESKGREITTENVREATLLDGDDYNKGIDRLIQTTVNSSMARKRNGHITGDSYYYCDGRQQKLNDIIRQKDGASKIKNIALSNRNKAMGLLNKADQLVEFSVKGNGLLSLTPPTTGKKQ